MSLVWDFETDIDPIDALCLRNSPRSNELSPWTQALHQQKRAPLLPLNLPLIQPIIWASPSLLRSESVLGGLLHSGLKR